MAQRVINPACLLAVKPDDLSSIPTVHMVEREMFEHCFLIPHTSKCE